MKLRVRRCALILAVAIAASLTLSGGQLEAFGSYPQREGDVKLPSGKSQRDEILKAERERNIKDATRLAELSQELKEELEKNDRFVLSISTLRKTDEIEKLARKIRSRLRHN
jgi:hypothetical protein